VVNMGGGENPASVTRLLAIVSRLTRTRPEPVRAPPLEGDVRLIEAEVSLVTRYSVTDRWFPWRRVCAVPSSGFESVWVTLLAPGNDAQIGGSRRLRIEVR
jgi:hypothetical protein